MKHSLCIIDDAIPASNHPEFIDDTKILGTSVLEYLLENEEWNDPSVRSLISRLVAEKDTWQLDAFRNPSFFFNHIENAVLASEIIIFDWDYDGRSDDSETYLLRLLRTTYSLIYVFTSADMEGSVTKTLESEPFQDYADRLGLIRKEDEGSAEDLLAAANQRYDQNFSFRFGKELKLKACKALDEILIEISKLSLEDFVGLFGEKKGNKVSIAPVEFASIISEKFKHQLLKEKFENEIESLSGELDDSVVKKIWSYRLYHHPVDDVVRKGDIISTNRGNGDRLALVLSSDCHMERFWKKNYGFVSLVPLHKLTPGNVTIKTMFGGNKPANLKQFKLTSLTNSPKIEGVTILPGIPDKNGAYSDYLLNSKEVTYKPIKLPEVPDSEKYDLKLMYRHWKGYTGKNRIRVSEPFLSPLIQFVMEYVTGYGCPDFPEPLQNQIKKSFTDAIT